MNQFLKSLTKHTRIVKYKVIRVMTIMSTLTRRDFLKTAGVGGLFLVSPLAGANIAPISVQERKLSFRNLHTGEKLTATYWAEGEYISEELAAIDHLLRDHRRDVETRMDRKLFDQLYALQLKLGKEKSTIHVISGYRSPKTNAQLHRNTSGVAKKSLHTMGKAIDLRIPGVDLKHLRKAALEMKAGGVGYYPSSNFVHLDTGRPRFW